MSATVLFQPKFILRKVIEGREDPITGEPGRPTITEIAGRGLVQEPLWSSEKEVGPTSVKDERLILFCPTHTRSTILRYVLPTNLLMIAEESGSASLMGMSVGSRVKNLSTLQQGFAGPRGRDESTANDLQIPDPTTSQIAI
ncbi:hypothetical protein [Corynebacterium diphtheriae]|uniref:hypothetical protein n=1 Tax=Corynebacterium diphtheriae TaxID=1717 RepID=UPI001FDA39DB|nr:hypothetical protein [Corynebacterium diphtheriae]